MFDHIDAMEDDECVQLNFHCTTNTRVVAKVTITKELASRMGIMDRISAIKEGREQKEDSHPVVEPAVTQVPTQDQPSQPEAPAASEESQDSQFWGQSLPQPTQGPKGFGGF